MAYLNSSDIPLNKSHRGRDRIVVGKTTSAISAYHH
jgi:hypothetical protein